MRKTTREIQKEATRRKILEAAYREYGKHGILATRMSDVAAAAGVSHGAVFAHFSSQEQLISAVIEEYGARIASRTHTLAESGSGVRGILSAHLKGIAEFEPFYTRLTIESRMLPADSRGALFSVNAAVSSHLSRAAEAEIADGKIKNIPAFFLFNSWIGLISYYLVNGDLFAPGGSVISRCGQELLDNFMRIISKGGNE